MDRFTHINLNLTKDLKTMNELATNPTKLKSPLQLKGNARELKELQDLLNLHNNATDGHLDPLARTSRPIHAPVAPSDPEERPSQMPATQAEANHTPPNRTPIDHSRLFFTGRLMTGKDYCAKSVGARIESFAQPLYFLLEHFFGLTEAEKDKGRAFMQTVGQWGRGYVSEKVPFTPERAALIAAIRSESKRANFPDALGVDWEAFGRKENLWLDAALFRVSRYQKEAGDGAIVALTNVRFTNEYTALRNLGWSGWHVMCSPHTWASRLAAKKLNANSPETQDVSEAFAAAMDQKVFTAIRSKNGNKLRVIWSDEKQPPVSTRFHSLESFAAVVKRRSA